jgi:integrase
VQWFDQGLGVRVSPKGTKTFIYWYSFKRRKRLMTLGEYPAVSVAEARDKHREAQRLASNGVDPIEHKAEEQAKSETARRAAKAAADAEANRPTLRAEFLRWKETALVPRVDSDGSRHGRKDGGATLLLQFEKHVFPTLGATPLADITRGSVLGVLDEVKGKGMRRTAAVIYSTMRQFLRWCELRDRIERNPMSALQKKEIVGRAATRSRVLADWEITRFMHRLPLLDLHPVTVLALRMVLATGQRPGEVAGMRKSEIDATGTLWIIPAERYKTSTVHRVPLSAHARELVALASVYNSGSDYVFPSPQSQAKPPEQREQKPLDRHSLSRAISRKLGSATPADATPAAGTFGMAPFRPHDLRRTCRTGLAALAVPEHVAEQVIGHKLQGMLAVYNQHDYLDERRDALNLWGEKLDKLCI